MKEKRRRNGEETGKKMSAHAIHVIDILIIFASNEILSLIIKGAQRQRDKRTRKRANQCAYKKLGHSLSKLVAHLSTVYNNVTNDL